MSGDFRAEDLVEEYGCLPEYLHESREASKWLCEVLVNIRSKQCGKEEIAWILGIPSQALCDQLPSSADAGLFGTNLLDLGFLPRGAGCVINGSRSAAYLNGRKCTLCRDLRDGIDQHATVIIEGGTKEERSEDEEELKLTMMIARKNMELACAPDPEKDSGFPPLSLAPSEELDNDTAHWSPSEMLGEVWVGDSSSLPPHLQSPDAMLWLTSVVGKLVESKCCGREEVCYLFNFDASKFATGFGGSAVPSSIAPEHAGSVLEELGFVPKGTSCEIGGCNSNAHLNGRTATLSADCPDGQQYAKVDLGDLGELQLHRKNLRLAKSASTEQVIAQDDSAAPAAATPGAQSVISEAAAPQDAVADDGGIFGSWWPFNIFCCGNTGPRTCCSDGPKAPALSVVQDELTNYSLHDSDAVQSDMHPSFGPAMPVGSSVEVSLADELRHLAQLKVAGDISETDFQMVKSCLLANAASGKAFRESLQQLLQFKKNDQVTAAEYDAVKKKMMQSSAAGAALLVELKKLLSLRTEGFLTDAEFARSKTALIGDNCT